MGRRGVVRGRRGCLGRGWLLRAAVVLLLWALVVVVVVVADQESTVEPRIILDVGLNLGAL